MHLGTIFALEALLILLGSLYDEVMSWSKTMKPESSYSQDLPCRRNAQASLKDVG